MLRRKLHKPRGKTLSAVVQDALRAARVARLRKELSELQDYWSRRAKEQGILTEKESRAVSGSVKVVFDTNVFVSALTLPGGRGAEALGRIIEGQDNLAFSKPILDELLSVLARKFARNREELARVAVFLSSLGERVESNESLEVLVDEPDNRILECALAASAATIVTGDRDMLALRSFKDVRILSPSEYLKEADAE